MSYACPSSEREQIRHFEADLWGSGIASIYFLAACWFVTRTYRYALRTGLLARYSAESAA